MNLLAVVLLAAVCRGDFGYADVTSLVRVPNFELQKGVTSSDGVYILGTAQDTVTVAKIDLQATTVLWTARLTLVNTATAVDLAAGQSSVWLGVNVHWNKTEALPGLMSSQNPRVGTWHGLLVSLSKASGGIEWTQWMGGCLGADSLLSSVTKVRNSYVATGVDSCTAGLWLGGDAWSKYISGKGSCQTGVLTASDQSAYLATACLDDIAGAFHPQPGKFLPTLFKLSLQGDILWARIFPSTSPPSTLQASAVTIMPLTSLDYIALFAPSATPSLLLVDSAGMLQWAAPTPFSSIAGLTMDPSKGIVVVSSNTLIWFSYESVLRSSRTYPNGSMRGAPLLTSSFDTVVLLFSSSETMYTSVYTDVGVSSAVVVSASSPFAVRNCTSVCNTCFAQRSDSCFECNSYLAAPFACGTCHSSCSSCFGPDNTMCRTCAGNYQLSGSQCVLDLNCPFGQYTDQSLHACQPCNSLCSGCSGPGPANCTSCASGLAKNDKVCVSDCPSYRVNISGQCLDCALPCVSCNGLSPQNCTVCPPSNFLLDGACLPACPISTFAQGSNCVHCVPGCAQCNSSSPGNCTQCISGYFADSGNCVQKCPPSTAGENGVCVQCPSNCTQCAQSNVCTVCAEGFFWDKSACKPIPNCSLSSFFNGTACVPCNPKCARCWGTSNTQCFSCQKDYFLRNSSCTELMADCTPGFFLSSNNTCELCNSNCSACLNSTFCLSCLSPLLYADGSCLSACPSNYFQSNATCVQCGDNCEMCTNQGVCTKCGSGAFLSSGRCVPACPANTLPRNGQCVSCGEHCAVCSQSACSTCVSGYYPSTGYCFACPLQCSLCSSPLSCSDCQAGFHLYNSTCVLACPIGWAAVDSVCESCQAGCERCSSPDVCTVCEVSVEMGGRYALQAGVCDTGNVVCYPGFTLTGGVCAATDVQYSRDFLSAAVWLSST